MMKEAPGIGKIIGIVFLGLFVLLVGLPLVLAAAGIVLGGIMTLVGAAIAVIKLAVLLAVGYLILVAIRAVLR